MSTLNRPDAIPDFNTAVSQFRDFLRGHGYPVDISWVWREDLTSYKKRVYIRVPLPDENRACAERVYLRGRESGWGVCIQVFCRR